MVKMLEVFYEEKKAKERLKYYKEKGLKIYRNENRAVSSYLDITIAVRSRGLFDKLEGAFFEQIDFDYMPSTDLINKAKRRANRVVIDGIEYY